MATRYGRDGWIEPDRQEVWHGDVTMLMGETGMGMGDKAARPMGPMSHRHRTHSQTHDGCVRMGIGGMGGMSGIARRCGKYGAGTLTMLMDWMGMGYNAVPAKGQATGIEYRCLEGECGWANEAGLRVLGW